MYARSTKAFSTDIGLTIRCQFSTSTLAFLACLFQEMVDEGAGDAYLAGNFRHSIRREPPGIQDLIIINLDLAAGVFRSKTNHEGIRKGPGLTSEITDVFDVNARFFLYFSPHCIFQGFAWLNEASKDAIEPLLEARLIGQEGLCRPAQQGQ